jgi:indolepyruvate ferredoxin oxidoreductase beta subunit
MSEAPSLRILVVGVGGQGVIFASKLIGEAMLETGHNVVMSEVHGMAQRGGVVTCQICIGNIHSPIIGDGEADLLLAFEPIEAYRTIQKANKETVIIINTEPLIPTSANFGDVEYPDKEEIIQVINDVNENLLTLNGSEIAADLGSHLVLNSVMIGALAGTGKLPLEPRLLKDHLLAKVPKTSIEQNSKAFDRGLAATQ